MSFPDKEKIETLKENGNLELLAELDSQGLLIAPGETAAGYADRLLAEEERIGKLREKRSIPIPGLRSKRAWRFRTQFSKKPRRPHAKLTVSP